MTNKILILDCTLRDGGYINNWNFSNKQINRTISALEKSKIDIIEIGYLNDKVEPKENSTLYPNQKIIDQILQDTTTSKKVAMINLHDYDIDRLKHKDKTFLDGIRLAFHKKDLHKAIRVSQKIISLGYKLFFQPMVTKNYSESDFLSMLYKVNTLKPYAFYIVDSFGSMTLNEFNNYLILADKHLEANILLGYHAHNNMQLAFSNAISMCQSNIKRPIIIDASIYGIGRGAGNLNTELITEYINNSFSSIYQTLPLLEIIDEYLEAMMRQTPWGFTPAQFLSASYNCHPNYATYLINKNTNHIVGIKKVLEKLPHKNKSSFNKAIIETLYTNMLFDQNTTLQGIFNIPKNKKILLIASGQSTSEYKALLEDKANDTTYVTIALNHQPKFPCTYYFFTNQKRYDEFFNKVDLTKTIVTSNILVQATHLAVIDLEPLAFVEEDIVINVTIIFLNYLIKNNITTVEIAGLDGYDISNINNYSYTETSVISDHKSLLEQNDIIKHSINVLSQNIAIQFITPTIFKDAIKLKILGVIPARYKSTRFPGKPLCLIKDIPMIKRTYDQAKQSTKLNKLVVATDSIKIKEYCLSEQIPVVMTSENCLTGTDRIAEVSQNEHYDLYVNIQGDEPVIDPTSIDEIVGQYLLHKDNYVAYNLYKTINDNNEIYADTIIKTIVNEKDELMYMSRLNIPFNKSNTHTIYKKQVCVYGFTKKALDIFSSRTKTLNEEYEDIEILRFIDMGFKVKMKETHVDSIAVDIPNDVKKVESFLNQKGLD